MVKEIQYLFPNAVIGEDIIFQNDGYGDYIKEWNIINEIPSDEIIQATALLVSKSELDVEIKQAKEEALNSIVVTTASGKVFDGRDKDRARMNEAIMASSILGLTSTQWKMGDNTIQTITLDELKEALALSIQAVGAIIVG